MAGVKIIEERCTGMLLKKRNGGIDMAENMTPAEETKEVVSKNFIEQEIDKDLAEGVYDHVQTRFPPEPNGYLHIGHAKSIILNSGLAKEYGGKFNLRFDDTNPTKEKTEFVHSITEDVKWLGADFEDRLFFASDYFDTMYECAVKLIKKGKAFVIMDYDRNHTLIGTCDLKDGKLEGEYKMFYPNGKIKTKFYMENGKPSGLLQSYDETGRLDTEKNYKDGLLHGVAKFYRNGMQVEEIVYENGNEVKS